MKRDDSHISDQNLLLSVDGELSPRMAARVHAHLSNCWECRTRRQEIESAIADFIRIRQRSIDPLLPPIAGPRALLRAHLTQLGEARPRIWLDWFTEQVSARAAIFAALVGVAMVGIFRLSMTPPVSASEVLSRTRQAEVRQVERIPSAVIYEKLQLSRHSGSRLDTVTWEIWDDMQHQRLRQRAESEGEDAGRVTAIPSTHPTRKDRPVGDLVEIYRSHQADLGRPLCAANYETWRAAIPQVSETVREGQLPDGEKATILEASGRGYVPAETLGASDGALLPADGQALSAAAASAYPQDSPSFKQGTISNQPAAPKSDRNDGTDPLAAAPSAKPPAGEIPSAPEPEPHHIFKTELVVRSADWHPVEERLWVDDREYKITELDYKVVPLSEVDALVFAPPSAPVERVKAPHPVLMETAETLVPPPPDPDETEMAVRFGLHQLNADLGEPIDISLGSKGNVIVDASALAPELQARLQEQLAGIPNADLVLKRPPNPACESCAVPDPALQETSLVASAPALRIVPAANPNEKRLEEIFGDPHAQESFTRDVLAVSEQTLSQCFALRNLALRYPPEDEGKLTLMARAQLKEMVDDHIAALVEGTNHLQGLLRPLLEALSNSSTRDVDSPQAVAKGLQSDEATASMGAGPTKELSPKSASPWQNTSFKILAAVQKADALVKGLLPSTNNPMPADQVVPELRQALTEQHRALNQYQGLTQAQTKTDK